jgi:hypothetical protein
MTTATKTPKFDKVPGVSEKRVRGVFDDLVEGLTQHLTDAYYGTGAYSTDGTVVAVDEHGKPSEVRPVRVFSSVDPTDGPVGGLSFSEYDVRNLPAAKRAAAVKAVYRTVLKALRRHRYTVDMTVGYVGHYGQTYSVGDTVHTDGDSFERGMGCADATATVPVVVTVTGARVDGHDGVRMTAELRMVG